MLRVATAALVLALAAPAAAAAPAKVTRHGVGKVKIGATHKKLHAKGLLGPKVPGCNLAGPGQKAAKLRGGVEGAVQLTRSEPRRVRTILVTKGAAAHGVGIGDRKGDIKSAFPHADFDASTRQVFGITLVTVPFRDGGRFQFGIETGSHKISIIGVPTLAFCE
jgi:hypothetical protein